MGMEEIKTGLMVWEGLLESMAGDTFLLVHVH